MFHRACSGRGFRPGVKGYQGRNWGRTRISYFAALPAAHLDAPRKTGRWDAMTVVALRVTAPDFP